MKLPQLKKQLTIIEIAFLATFSFILATPIVYSTSLLNGILSFKLFYLFLLACVISILAFLQLLRPKMYKTRMAFNATDVIVGIFFLYLVVNSFYGSCSSNFSNERDDKLVYFICSISVYFSIKVFLQNDSILELFLKLFRFVLFWVVLFECIFAILQMFSVFPSLSSYSKLTITGTFKHPAMLAVFLAVVIPYIYSQCKLNFIKPSDFLNTQFLLLLIAIIVLILSKSRDGIISAIVGVFYFNLKLDGKFRKIINSLSKNKWILFLTTLLLFIAIIGAVKIRTFSVYGRILIWKICWPMVKDAPIFGHGIGSFKDIYPPYQIMYFQFSHNNFEKQLADFVSFPYNEYLQILIELGIVGLILFILLIASVFLSKNKNKNIFVEELGVKSSILSFALFGIVSYPFSLNYMTLYFFIFLGIISAANRTNSNILSINKWIVALILIFPFLFCKKMYSKFYAYRQVVIAEQSTSNIDFANQIYSKLYSTLYNDNYYLSMFAESQYNANHPKLGLKIIFQKHGLTYADYLLIGDMYLKEKNSDSAMKYYLNAHYLLPNQSVPVKKINQLKNN